MQKPITFPWRDLLSGVLRGMNEDEIQQVCGEPDDAAGDLRIYRFGRDVPMGTLGDPRSVTVQFWFTEGIADHAALRLVFAEDFTWDEVLW